MRPLVAPSANRIAISWPVTCLQSKTKTSGGLNQFISQLFGSSFESEQPVLLITSFEGFRAFIQVSLSPPKQAIEESGEFAGGGKDRDVAADPSRDVTVVSAECRLTVAQRGSGHAQGGGDAGTGGVASFLFQRLAGAGWFVGGELEMGDEVVLRFEATQIGAVLTQQHLHRSHANRVDGGQVDAAHAV